MRSFLGMINYLNRYSALSAHLTVPLSTLTHQAVDYKPGKVHYENFNRLKMEVSNMWALPYFDVNAETTLQMDAFKKELGVCIIQKGKVVCYASRALTKTEQNNQNLYWKPTRSHFPDPSHICHSKLSIKRVWTYQLQMPLAMSHLWIQRTT